METFQSVTHFIDIKHVAKAPRRIRSDAFLAITSGILVNKRAELLKLFCSLQVRIFQNSKPTSD